MEKWKKRSVELLTSLVFGSDGSPSVVPYYPQKTAVSGEDERYFVRSTPEKHGISSKRLYNMLCDLESEQRANIHSLMILAQGEVICECARDGYGVNTWHLSHSMSKTVTGMAVGMLVDDGLLDVEQRLVDIFPDMPYKDKKFPLITVDHLLAMTTGVPFNEFGTVTETNWTEVFFAATLKYTPGTEFNYNSMNSYILAKIVEKITGRSMTDFLEERLFAPLGIKNYFWERSPESITKGGWGLYMSSESWAKLGQMVLEDGVFAGRRILSEEWIEQSTNVHAKATDASGDFDYGYQLWVGRDGDEVLFNGMLGQNVWICPHNGIVAMIFSGNNELFQTSPALDIVRKYFGGVLEDNQFNRKDVKALHERETTFFDCRRWVRPLEKRRGLFYWLGLRARASFDESWDSILGEYAFGKNNSGLLPLFVRVMQNNMDCAIERLELKREGDKLMMTVDETGTSHTLEVGLYEYKEAVLDFNGEKYTVKVMGESMIGADGNREYRIELLFPELPNTRMIVLRHGVEGRIGMSLSEMPNHKILEAYLTSIPASNPAIGLGLDMLEKRFGEGFIHDKVVETFAPRLIGANTAFDGYEEIVNAETLAATEKSRAVKLLCSFVQRFFKDSAPEDPKPQRSFLGGLLDRVRGKRAQAKSEPTATAQERAEDPTEDDGVDIESLLFDLDGALAADAQAEAQAQAPQEDNENTEE